MQINSYNGNLPLSTQVINKYGPSNPEQVNKVVDATSNRVAERQESRELSQAAKRDTAAKIYSANTQQRQIETYLAVVSESKVESPPSPLDTAVELRDTKQRYELAQNIDDLPSRSERPENRPAKPEPYATTSA